jgi:hypothetical protein
MRLRSSDNGPSTRESNDLRRIPTQRSKALLVFEAPRCLVILSSSTMKGRKGGAIIEVSHAHRLLLGQFWGILWVAENVRKR